MQPSLQRLAVFYCGDCETSKVIVYQLIMDSGLVGVDTGWLWMDTGVRSHHLTGERPANPFTFSLTAAGYTRRRGWRVVLRLWLVHAFDLVAESLQLSLESHCLSANLGV